MLNEKKGIWELVFAMILSGTIGFFVIESGQKPFNVVFYRCLFGMIALGSYCLTKRLFKKQYLTVNNIFLMSLGSLCIVFNWFFLFKSYSLTSIAVATIIYHTQPFFVLFIGSILFREKISANKLFWSSVSFIGMILVSGIQNIDLQKPDLYVNGICYALIAAFLYSIATLVAKYLKHIKPHVIAFIQVFIGAICLYPFTRLEESPTEIESWGMLIILGVVHTCILYIYLYSSFQKLKLSQIAVTSFLYPAVAVLVDFFAYDTRINFLQSIGIIFILTSNLGVNLNWLNKKNKFTRNNKREK